MKTRNRQCGLTLHELIVGVAVVAILVTLAAPAYTQFIAKRRLAGASNLIAMYFEDIKMLSIKRNEFITVSYQKNGDGTQWCLGAALGNAAACDCTAAPPQCLTDSGFSILTDQTYPEFSDITSEFVAGNMTFDPVRGILTDPASAMQMQVRHDTGIFQVNVSVNATGTVRKCSPAEYALVGYPTCI